ncbi:MAG TPA: TonB-dependent receptor, partial [Thermoanaerobaculia bacterium]
MTIFLALFLAATLTTRIVDADGKPVAHAQVSVAGQQGAARTDADGRVTIPNVTPPATLLVVGSAGQLFRPLQVGSFAPELRLDRAFTESVSVTSGAAPNIEATPAAARVVVGAEELDERKPAHVVDAIARIPGASIRGEGPAAVPILRGLGSGRTMLLFDDAPIVAERRAGPSATFLDPLLLGSIEIARGPGATAYGSDAIGGIVHFRPRDPVRGDPSLRFDVWGSAGAERIGSIAVETSADLFGGAMLAAVHARSASDAENPGGEPIVPSSYRDRGLMLRFVRDADWGRLRAGVTTSVARDVGAPSSEATKTTYPEENSTLVTFGLDLQPSRFFTAAAMRASLGSYAIETLRGTASAVVKARDASFRISGTRYGERSRLVTGIGFVSRFDLRAPTSVEDADRHDLGAFATYEQRVTPLVSLAGGARVDRVASHNRGGFAGDREHRDTAFSGHAAIAAGPLRNVTATLQVATGYREPTLSDRYFRGVSGRGFVTGNPELSPETSLQFDGALRWSHARATVALFGYDYRIDDLVERYRSGADFFFRNRGEARVRGLELEATAHLPRRIDVIAGAAVARGEATDSGSALDD